MEEPDADRCDVTVSPGLDRGEVVSDLHEPLEGLEQSSEEHTGGEPAGSDEDLDDS
jgi:hypothetical protein